MVDILAGQMAQVSAATSAEKGYNAILILDYDSTLRICQPAVLIVHMVLGLICLC